MEDPLLPKQSPSTTTTGTETGTGTSSSLQTIGNIVVSIIGTGILGLPYAFRIAGWLTGSLGIILTGIASYYCMLLLVQCKDGLQAENRTADVRTYGDLGFNAYGMKGRYLSEILIMISQFGGSVAYLVFIGQNISSVLQTYNFTVSSIILLLIPLQIALSSIRSLAAFSPFSVFADICNILAMAIVLKQDLEVFNGFSKAKAVTSLGGLPFAGGVAVFCYDGFGMTLALEGSMKERRRFPWVLGQAFLGIVVMYVCFGLFGYLAYGDETKDIITLNLPNNWASVAVKIGLCTALTFTLPMVLHPVHEIIEAKLNQSEWFQKLCFVGGTATEKSVLYTSRAVVPVAMALLALWVPGFGVFVSMVGSTVCALLSYVLPTSFHLILNASSMGFCRKALDVAILVSGLAFALYGTYNTVIGTPGYV